MEQREAATHICSAAPGRRLIMSRAVARTGRRAIRHPQEAIDHGRRVSRSQETELRIHNRDGRIAQSDSHGRDPNPPKG